jgi:hypothetical protein
MALQNQKFLHMKKEIKEKKNLTLLIRVMPKTIQYSNSVTRQNSIWIKAYLTLIFVYAKINERLKQQRSENYTVDIRYIHFGTFIIYFDLKVR